MNIQQFEYVLAVAELKHFELAAQKCFVTQSTLSTMILKFEDEVGFKIFDRKKKPIEITNEGKLIIKQLKIIKHEIDQLNELKNQLKGEISGSLSISVIPTIAPFLLPLFLNDFALKFPNLSIIVREETTAEITKKLKSRELDIGILSIPLKDKEINEITLYNEPFLFYDSDSCNNKTSISIKEIKTKNVCLMEEGHCMRTQILQICNNLLITNNKLNFEFKAGSIDSLVRFVKTNNSCTLLPLLSTIDFTETEKAKLRDFNTPIPYRSVGLVTHRHFVKNKLLKILTDDISSIVSKISQFNDFNNEKLQPF